MNTTTITRFAAVLTLAIVAACKGGGSSSAANATATRVGRTGSELTTVSAYRANPQVQELLSRGSLQIQEGSDVPWLEGPFNYSGQVAYSELLPHYVGYPLQGSFLISDQDLLSNKVTLAEDHPVLGTVTARGSFLNGDSTSFSLLYTVSVLQSFEFNGSMYEVTEHDVGLMNGTIGSGGTMTLRIGLCVVGFEGSGVDVLHRSGVDLATYLGKPHVNAVTATRQVGSGGSIRLRRATDAVMLSSGVQLDTAGTIEVQVWLDRWSSVGNVYREWGSGGSVDKWLTVGSGGIHAHAINGGGTVGANLTVIQDQWHHVAWVYDGTEQRLYLDGNLIDSLPTIGSIGNGVGMGFVGGSNAPWEHAAFTGYIGSLRVSTIPRYTGNNFNAPSGDFISDAGTTVLFTFDDAWMGTTVSDSSGNGNHGLAGAGFPGVTRPALGVSPTSSTRSALLQGAYGVPALRPLGAVVREVGGVASWR